MKQARKPEVKVESWGGKKRIIQEISYMAACSSWPSLSATHHVNSDAQDGAVRITAEEMFKSLGEQQKKAFDGAGNADTQVSIDVDDQDMGGSTLEFKGIALGDTYDFSAHNVSVRGAAMPEWALMDMLNYSIYGDFDSDTNKVIESSSSVIEIIQATEQRLMTEAWSKAQEKLSQDKGEGAKQTLQNATKIHQRNQKVRQYFKQVISNSQETFGWSSLDKLFKDRNQRTILNRSIANVVMRVLVGGRGGFLATLNSLANQFQCIYVPGKDPTDPGKLVNMGYLVAAEPETLEIKTLASASLRAGSPAGLLPIGYVHVLSPINGNTNVRYPYTGASVPKENLSKGGAEDRVEAPDWAAQPGIDAFAKEKTTQYAKAEKPESASITKTEQAVQRTEKDLEKWGTSVQSVAAAWGLCHYAWTSLAHCTAALSVPGTFKPELGKRYKVQQEGKELFTGFLYSISTTVSAESCLTSLNFSHIMATGFSLPGTQEMKEANLVK